MIVFKTVLLAVSVAAALLSGATYIWSLFRKHRRPGQTVALCFVWLGLSSLAIGIEYQAEPYLLIGLASVSLSALAITTGSLRGRRDVRKP